jgi:hypothetical protein
VRWRGVQDTGDAALDLIVLSPTGQRLVTIDGLRLRPVSREAPRATRPRRYEVVWHPVSGGAPAPLRAGNWPVSGTEPDLVREWRAALSGRDGPVHGAIVHGGRYLPDGGPDRAYRLLQPAVTRRHVPPANPG